MSTYLNEKFTKHIKDVNTIIECGSRDCIDAISMFEFYKPNKIYSFECNPESISTCLRNIINYPEIELIQKAVSDKDGQIDFYATDMEKSIDKNIGASSALYHRDNKVDFFQKKITVESITLDKFVENKKITNVDLLLLDLQGYEKHALTGFEKNIENVKYIISEISFQSYYNNDILFDEYRKYLDSVGFTIVEILNYGGFGDGLFINKKLFN
jgi:FkbM family methyltransferase